MLDHNTICRVVSVRLNVPEEIVKKLYSWQWNKVRQLLSNPEYSSIKIKNFGNFEVVHGYLLKEIAKRERKFNDYKQRIKDFEPGTTLYESAQKRLAEKEQQYLVIKKFYDEINNVEEDEQS